MSKSTQVRRSAVLGVLCACALLLAAGPEAAADVIRLRTGEIVKGTPLPARSNEETLVVEDAVSGNLRRLAWTALEPKDARRYREAWGFEAPELRPVAAVRLRIVLEGGMTTEVVGVVVHRSETHLDVQSFGRVLPVERARIHAREAVKVDPRDVWTPGQLVERFAAALPAKLKDASGKPSTLGHLRCARFAETVGAYTQARFHYEHVQRDDASPHAAFARERLAAVKVHAERMRWLREVREARQAVQLGSYRRARARLEEVRAAIPEPNGPLAVQLERAERVFAEHRGTYFRRRIGSALPRAVERLVDAKVKERALELTEAAAWARRELEQAAFLAATRALQDRDDVPLAEVRRFWNDRERGSWRTVSYGAGSFIVEPPKTRPPKGAKPAPRAAARETWWADVDRQTRATWLFAFFVENSGLFAVETVRGATCPTCEGTGVETRRLADGRLSTIVCRRCHGARHDRALRFR